MYEGKVDRSQWPEWARAAHRTGWYLRRAESHIDGVESMAEAWSWARDSPNPETRQMGERCRERQRTYARLYIGRALTEDRRARALHAEGVECGRPWEACPMCDEAGEGECWPCAGCGVDGAGGACRVCAGRGVLTCLPCGGSGHGERSRAVARVDA